MNKHNVIPIQKYSHFAVFTGLVGSTGEVTEQEQIGIAFIKEGSRMFRLKLWMWPNEQYFIASDDNDSDKYRALSLDEYVATTGENRSRWNEIGVGQLTGCLIKISLTFPKQDIFINLYPGDARVEEERQANNGAA
jgi:hypothetical protein